MSYCAIGNGTIDLKCAAEEVPSEGSQTLKDELITKLGIVAD